MPFLPPNQQRQSNEGGSLCTTYQPAYLRLSQFKKKSYWLTYYNFRHTFIRYRKTREETLPFSVPSGRWPAPVRRRVCRSCDVAVAGVTPRRRSAARATAADPSYPSCCRRPPSPVRRRLSHSSTRERRRSATAAGWAAGRPTTRRP